MLTAAGIPDVRILDGGLAAWTAAGGAVETGAVVPEPGDVTVRHDDLYAGALPTLSAEQATAVGDPSRRAGTRAVPRRCRADRSGGRTHPGARNVPSTGLWPTMGRFSRERDLTRLFGDIDNVGAYCGSGVTASVVVAALASVGIDAALYPGSWSEWCSDPMRPVERA